MSRAETNFGETKAARIGNPFIYAQRFFILLLNSVFAQEQIIDYGSINSDDKKTSNAPLNPFRIHCNKDGTIDVGKSKLIITHAFQEETPSAQPQIVVHRGTASWSNQSIGDNARSFGLATPKLVKSFADRVAFPIMIEIFSKNDIEAEEIAWIVNGSIRFYERIIRSNGLIHSIDSPLTSSCQIYRGDGDYRLFKIDISLNVQFAVQWIQRTTLDVEAFNKAICKLSDSDWPRVVSDICIIANTVD